MYMHMYTRTSLVVCVNALCCFQCDYFQSASSGAVLIAVVDGGEEVQLVSFITHTNMYIIVGHMQTTCFLHTLPGHRILFSWSLASLPG